MVQLYIMYVTTVIEECADLLSGRAVGRGVQAGPGRLVGGGRERAADCGRAGLGPLRQRPGHLGQQQYEGCASSC